MAAYCRMFRISHFQSARVATRRFSCFAPINNGVKYRGIFRRMNRSRHMIPVLPEQFRLSSTIRTTNSPQEEEEQKRLRRKVHCLQSHCRVILLKTYTTKEGVELDASLLLEKTSILSGVLRDPSNRKSRDDDAGVLTCEQDLVNLLHQSFIRLASKSLAFNSPTIAMAITRRAHASGLVFYRPLYQQLMEAAASSSQAEFETILEVADMASMEAGLMNAPFFVSSLGVLIQRGKFQEATLVLHAMKQRYDISNISLDATLHLLRLLKDRLEGQLEQWNTAEFEEEDVPSDLAADATELMILLQQCVSAEHLLEDNTYDSAEWDNPSLIQHLSQVLEQQQHNEKYDSEDESEIFDDDDELELVSPSELLRVSWDIMQQEHKDQHAKDDEHDAATMMIHQVGGDKDNVNRQHPLAAANQELMNDHADVIRDTIYMRDSSRWKLPDVTQQLVDLNRGAEVLYHPMFEEVLLQDLVVVDRDE